MDRNNMRHSYSSNGGSRQSHHMNSLNGKSRPSGGLNRLSPPAELPSNHNNPHNDLINYIYESWEKINREAENGGRVDIYYKCSKQLPIFDLESWCEQRRLQPVKRNSYNS